MRVGVKILHSKVKVNHSLATIFQKVTEHPMMTIEVDGALI